MPSERNEEAGSFREGSALWGAKLGLALTPKTVAGTWKALCQWGSIRVT